LNAAYAEMQRKEAYTVTAADKKGNTPAYQGLKAGKKNVKTGEPMYKAADHLKKEDRESKLWDEVAKMLTELHELRGVQYKVVPLNEKKEAKDYDGDGKIESGKDEYFGSKDKAIKKAMGKKVKKESLSDWRTDLSDLVEIVAGPEDRVEKEVKEKKVKNKVVINPKFTEAVEEMGGELLEMEVVKKELKDLKKGAETLKGKNIAKADKIEEKNCGCGQTPCITYGKENKFNEAMSSYDKARKAAARRAADRNAARRRGEMGGRMERETYTSEGGTRMHHKGYKAREGE
jgi:hypothetical protein